VKARALALQGRSMTMVQLEAGIAVKAAVRVDCVRLSPFRPGA
jgi:hypothetical protein